jgi:hypothetical protein
MGEEPLVDRVFPISEDNFVTDHQFLADAYDQHVCGMWIKGSNPPRMCSQLAEMHREWHPDPSNPEASDVS